MCSCWCLPHRLAKPCSYAAARTLPNLLNLSCVCWMCCCDCAEANRQLHAPEGPSAEQLAQLGALFVAQQAVYPDTTCCEDGCCEPAAVECRHCELVGVLRCAAHDAAAHCNAHEHHRLGVLGGFKQPLQPAQQYAAATSRCNCVCQHNHVVQQVPLLYPIAPLTPCSCGKGGQWQVDEGVSCGRTAATAKDGVGKPQQQPLIILTPKGVSPVVRILACCRRVPSMQFAAS